MMKCIPVALLIGSFMILSCSGPKSIFVANQKEAPALSTISFENSSQDALEYLWDFGDGNTSDELNPSHRYYYSGNYLVTLLAQNGKKVNKSEQRIKIDAPDKCLIRIETPQGEMIAELYDGTPLHRDNFTKLSNDGFYNDLLFHRVISDFMIQGGDPESKGASPASMLGSGGPGYQIPSEISQEFIHKKGALAAARQGDNVNPEKKSSGSQFYIVHGQKADVNTLNQIEAKNNLAYTKEQRETYMEEGGTPFLDGAYTVFGQVIEGLDIIDTIATLPCNRMDRPKDDIWMKISVIK